MLRLPAQNNTEVVFVNSDVLWELFTDTGEPACWLAYRAVSCSGGGKEDAAAC